MSLDQFKETLGKSLYGESPSKAKEKGICLNCKQPALDRCYSPAGKREFQISGLCEICFDEITNYPEEEPDQDEPAF